MAAVYRTPQNACERASHHPLFGKHLSHFVHTNALVEFLGLDTTYKMDDNDENDPWHLPLLTVFLFNVAVLWCFQISKWTNLFHAITSTKFFTNNERDKAGKIPPGEEPHVTIQICCYNEGGVVKETIARACCADWPLDRLTVQVLDDSTDVASVAIVSEAVAIWRARGVDVVRLTRPSRIGYKAGNLRHCFECIKGDFVAHFVS